MCVVLEYDAVFFVLVDVKDDSGVTKDIKESVKQPVKGNHSDINMTVSWCTKV